MEYSLNGSTEVIGKNSTYHSGSLAENIKKKYFPSTHTFMKENTEVSNLLGKFMDNYCKSSDDSQGRISKKCGSDDYTINKIMNAISKHNERKDILCQRNREGLSCMREKKHHSVFD